MILDYPYWESAGQNYCYLLFCSFDSTNIDTQEEKFTNVLTLGRACPFFLSLFICSGHGNYSIVITFLSWSMFWAMWRDLRLQMIRMWSLKLSILVETIHLAQKNKSQDWGPGQAVVLSSSIVLLWCWTLTTERKVPSWLDLIASYTS